MSHTLRILYNILCIMELCVCIMAAKKLPLEVEFVRAATYFHPDYLSYFKIQIKPTTPGNTIDMDLAFKRNFTMEGNPTTSVRFLRRSNKGPYQSLLSVSFNYCKLISGIGKQENYLNPNVAHMIKMVLENIKKYSNWPVCPILAGEYSIKNLRPEKKMIPPFVMPGYYQLEFANYITNGESDLYIRNYTLDIQLKRRKQ